MKYNKILSYTVLLTLFTMVILFNWEITLVDAKVEIEYNDRTSGIGASSDHVLENGDAIGFDNYLVIDLFNCTYDELPKALFYDKEGLIETKNFSEITHNSWKGRDEYSTYFDVFKGWGDCRVEIVTADEDEVIDEFEFYVNNKFLEMLNKYKNININGVDALINAREKENYKILDYDEFRKLFINDYSLLDNLSEKKIYLEELNLVNNNYIKRYKETAYHVWTGYNAMIVFYNATGYDVTISIKKDGKELFSGLVKKDQGGVIYDMVEKDSKVTLDGKYESWFQYENKYFKSECTLIIPTFEQSGTSNSYITGYKDHTLKPDGYITRAEVATMVYRLFNKQFEKKGFINNNVAFDDIKNTYANSEILFCARYGIVNGYSTGNGHYVFKPNNNITIGEILTLVRNLLYGATNNDCLIGCKINNKATWEKKAYYDLKKVNIANDYMMDNPKRLATRGDVIKILNDVSGRNIKTGLDQHFIDVTDSHRFIKEIEAASNTFDYTRDEEGFQIVK